MKERPILFNTEMVKAILEGRKTQTRRVIKDQPLSGRSIKHYSDNEWVVYSDSDPIVTLYTIKCPYGQVGDRLWVREMWDYTGQGLDCVYKADAKPTDIFPWEKYRPSIFMPRWASRITLEIVEIKVEKLQDISEADAIAEGLESLTRPNGKTLYSAPQCGDRPPYWESSASEAFMWLWDSINAKRGYSWESNTWCWCLSFKRLNNG